LQRQFIVLVEVSLCEFIALGSCGAHRLENPLRFLYGQKAISILIVARKRKSHCTHARIFQTPAVRLNSHHNIKPKKNAIAIAISKKKNGT
jgi:hypothetical protein